MQATVPGAADQPVPRDVSEAGGRIVRNALALSLARPVTWLSAIGLTILLPRYLGDTNLGKMNFAWVFADWFGLFAGLGIATYLTKEIARRPGDAATTALNALLIRVASACAVGLLAVLFASVARFDPLTRNLIYLLTVHMLLVVIAGTLAGALQGVQELRIVAVVDAVSKSLQFGLVAGVLVHGAGPIPVAVAYIGSDIFAALWLLLSVARKVGLRGPVDVTAWAGIVRAGSPYLLWETALLTYARVDVVILSLFAHDAVLGWYAAAYRIISIPLFLPVVVMTAVLPALSASFRDEQTFNPIARRAIQVVTVTTVPMAVGLMLVGGGIIRFFGYPDEFLNSVWPLALLAATLPLVGINMIVGSVLTAHDRQKQWAIAGVVAALLNLALNFVAIPYTQDRFGNGAIGAAAVTSLTEVWLIGAGLALTPRGVLDRGTYAMVLRCLAAAAVMALAVWPVRDLSVVVSVPLGALTYSAAALALRVVSPREVAQLRRQLRPA